MKFGVKLGEYAIATYGKLRRACGEHYLSRAQICFRRPRKSGK
jgi:hypothetical protein